MASSLPGSQVEHLAQAELVAGGEQRRRPRSPPASAAGGRRSSAPRPRGPRRGSASTGRPSLKAITRGMPCWPTTCWNAWVMPGFSSPLTLTRATWPSVASMTLLDDRAERAARSAPRRPQVDHDRHVHRSLEDVGLEGGIRRIEVGHAATLPSARGARPGRAQAGGRGTPLVPSRAVIAEEDVAGIDAGNVTAWLVEHVAGAVAPFRFDIIAGGHSNLTYLVLAADGRRLVLRRPPLGHVLASAHDMGREHRDHRRPAGLRRAGAAGARPLRRRRRQRRAVLRDGLRRRHRRARPRHRRARADTGRRASTPAARSSTRWRRSTPSTSMRPGSATSPSTRTTSPASCKRWYGQWNLQKTRELPLVDEVHDALAGDDPAAGPGDDRARRLPPRQHDRVARRRRAGRARLGDLHARRPARRRRAARGLLDRSRRRAERVGRAVDDGARVLEPRPHRGALRRGVRARRRRPRLLRRLRVLEAGVRAGGRVRPLPRRRARRPRPGRAAGVQGPGRRRGDDGRTAVGARRDRPSASSPRCRRSRTLSSSS